MRRVRYEAALLRLHLCARLAHDGLVAGERGDAAGQSGAATSPAARAPRQQLPARKHTLTTSHQRREAVSLALHLTTCGWRQTRSLSAQLLCSSRDSRGRERDWAIRAQKRLFDCPVSCSGQPVRSALERVSGWSLRDLLTAPKMSGSVRAPPQPLAPACRTPPVWLCSAPAARQPASAPLVSFLC